MNYKVSSFLQSPPVTVGFESLLRIQQTSPQYTCYTTETCVCLVVSSNGSSRDDFNKNVQIILGHMTSATKGRDRGGSQNADFF